MHPASAPIFTVDEKDVIRDLLKNSPEFKNFYENERKEKKENDLTWKVDKGNLSNEINAMFGNELMFGEFDKFVPTIRIRRSPAPITDAKTVAHEIIHFLRNQKKYAVEIRSFDQKYFNLAGKLASVVEDPIVDRILQDTYKFNILIGYKKFLRKSLKEIQKQKDRSQNYMQKIETMISFSGMILEWELIKDKDALKELDSFRTTFKKLYFPASEMSDELISIIHEKDIDSLENRKMIYDKIIKKFELQKIFYVLDNY